MDIGKRLKQLRENQNMTIYGLWKITGIEQAHIAKIENGEINPTLITIEKIAVAFGYTLSDLLNEDASVVYLSDNEQQLITAFRQLSSVNRELVKDLIVGMANPET